MVEKLSSVWESRDLPVLIEVARLVDEGGHADVGPVARATKLTAEEIQRSFRALGREGLVTGPTNARGEYFGISDVAGRAYQIVGLHPDPDDVLGRMVELLDDAIGRSTEETERTALQNVKAGLADVSRQTLAGFASGIATAYVMGLGQ